MLGEETNKKRSRYVPFHYSIILVQFNMYNHFPASWWGQARTKSNGVVKMSDEGRKDFEQVNVSWENYRKLCFSRTLIFQKTTWVEIVWLKELKRSSWEVKCRWPFQSAKLNAFSRVVHFAASYLKVHASIQTSTIDLSCHNEIVNVDLFTLHYSFHSRKFHWRKKVDRSQRMQAKPYQLWISLFKPSVVAIFSPIGVFPYPWLFPISNTHQPLNQKIWIIAITGSPLAFLFLWI